MILVDVYFQVLFLVCARNSSDILSKYPCLYSRVEGLAHVLPVPEDSVHSGAPRDVTGEAGGPAR